MDGRISQLGTEIGRFDLTGFLRPELKSPAFFSVRNSSLSCRIKMDKPVFWFTPFVQWQIFSSFGALLFTMLFDQFISDGRVIISFSEFQLPSADEYHLMITPAPEGSAGDQYRQIDQAISEFVEKYHLEHALVVFQRLFVSDIANQLEEIFSGIDLKSMPSCSVIQQPPVSGNKMAAWVYLVNFRNGEAVVKTSKNSLRLDHNRYQHLYTANLTSQTTADSSSQTKHIFAEYLDILKSNQMTLESNCLRTWIFVRDIDNNYSGMVKARNEVFQQEGLTPASHFIASTGIEGQAADRHNLTVMDAWAVGGLESTQITYLKGNSHLSPTHLYGVSFGRGTAIDYGDRRHIFISGTASIDQDGQILFERDIEGQMRRVFENVEVLLAEAGATFRDLSSMIVYLRDLADSSRVHAYLESRFQGIPYVVVMAPICRQGWLFEAECIAVVERVNRDYRDF
jgi:enamine deaminase RidA (YjgF/YER057c/UK114 family)